MLSRTGACSKTTVAVFVWVILTVVSSPLVAEERKAWRSWQIDNPAWAGLLGAVTLGIWPARFANDVEPALVYQPQAIADGALEYSRTHAERAFRFWRAVGFAAEAAFTMGFLVWRRRRQHRVLSSS